MEKKSVILWPVALIIACVILGGFYYAVEIKKQESIEKQNMFELESAKAQQQAIDDRLRTEQQEKAFCSDEAQDKAIEIYKKICAEDSFCTYQQGFYLTTHYESAYKTCLQGKGLE